MPHTNPDRPDSGLFCLILVARLHGICADAGRIRHLFADGKKALQEGALLRAARHLGLKARAVDSHWLRLQRTPLPVLAQHEDSHWFVIARIDAGRVLIHDPWQGAAASIERAQFDAVWNGRLILIARAKHPEFHGRTFGYRWFLPALIKYRRLFGEVLVASFFLQLFALVTPLFFQVVIDKVLVHRGLTTLDVLAVGLLAVSLFEAILGGLRTYVFSHTTNRVDVALGAQLFRHLLALPMAYFQARRTGDSVARVRELENIRSFITGSALTLLIDLLFTGVFLAVMYLYSPVLTAIVIASIPTYVALSLIITPLLRSRVSEKYNRGAENQAFLVEAVNGVETLKAMAVEPRMQRRWEEQLAAYVQASFRATNLGNIANQAAGFINKIVVVLILWIGARAVIEGSLSVGQLIAFNMLAARVSAPVLRLVQLWQDFQQAGVSLQRLGDIMNTPGEDAQRARSISLAKSAGAVRFERVSFSYHTGRAPVLHELSLDVAAGEIVGVVGRSGCGKSTLARLLQRLYVPQSGRVMIDGVDLSTVDPASLRRQVAVVPQESVLFEGTVRENIALRDPAMRIEKIVAAAQLAGAHPFILDMPEGYDTPVGERGVNLSGGQRQRIAIARAIVGDPRILIFDEATSALDYESERIVQHNLPAIARGRTLIIIAHRLSALRQASRILVLEDGRLVEQGRHEELLANSGHYAGLYRSQQA